LIPLSDGNGIPAVGFGVFKIPPADTEQAVGTALRTGYRHIDTAAMYGNERETGRAVAASGVPRDELYLVTKLWNADQGYESTLAAFDASMHRLGIEYLDLYLVHWPMAQRNKFVDTFKAFAHLRDQGRIRSIGVSNFEPEHLHVLIDATGIVPAVNQVELHPGCRRPRCGRSMPAWASRPRRGDRSGRDRCWPIRPLPGSPKAAAEHPPRF
jgi:2,5-diketo-D-gluconate reductase A